MQPLDLDILVVDDEPDLRLGLTKLLRATGARVADAASAEEALAFIEKRDCDLVISDIKMKGMSGVDLLHALRRTRPGIGVMLMTGFGTIELAVECLRNGALHFLTKPFDNEEILQTVTRIGYKILRSRRDIAPAQDFGLVAEDRRMREVLSLVGQVATTRVPVLIQGESGTGKELVARAIHRLSSASGSLIAVNCAALPDTLLEAELFGYRKGAFTGAERDYDGIMRRADGGTLFLDELPSMSPAFQAKLLRVVQEKSFQPLGSGETLHTDFRLIGATNRDLQQMVAEGSFRQDLYYRMNVFQITIPPLRDRPDDIEPLVAFFLQRAVDTLLDEGSAVPRVTPEAFDELRAWHWPGNVRELENAVQRAVILCNGRELHAHHFLFSGSVSELSDSDHGVSYEEAKQRLLERFQRQFLHRALERSNGNISHAAEECGLTRAAIQKMMRRLDIDRSTYSTD
ncbi:MAG: sigma-54-dependent Fis family transcriptional regulator [Bacteroidetes bacterium]|nr:sigma-54-dependent Fis family transcriptional regulator [Bacteroidota bacterium]